MGNKIFGKKKYNKQSQDQDNVKIINLSEAIQFNLQQHNKDVNEKLTVQMIAGVEFLQLKNLNLSNCHFNSLPKLKTPKLKILNCSGNQMTTIQQFASQSYPQLQQMNLGHNLLQILPELKTPNIKILILDCNKLQSMQQFSQGSYPLLWGLNLQQNNLKKLPKLNTLKLQMIKCEYNKLQSIQEFAKGDYPSLQSLYLHQNNIKHLPEFKLKKIINFHCYGNPIQTIKYFSITHYSNNLQSKTSFSNLRELYLHQNGIKNIQNLQFIDLNQVMTLKLSQNKIVSFNPLNKCKLSKVNCLQCQNNQDFNLNLSRMLSPNLHQFNYKNSIQIFPIMKLQTNKLKLRTYWYNSQQICPKRLQKVSKQRTIKNLFQ